MKIAIVTGASSRMGREFAKQITHFYKNLDEIWVIARRKERLEELEKTLLVPVRIFCGDLLHPPVYHELRAALEEEKPDIRMLVNAAGFGKSGLAEDILKEDQKVQLKMIDLNCIALSRMIFLCLEYMKEGSRIINLASAAAFCPQPEFVVYAATKSYVLSFSRGLNRELRPRNIYVTAVCPGPVDTEFFKVSGELENVLKKLTLVKASNVVKKALQDSRKKKEVSVYGIAMKCAWAGTKVIPHSVILKAMTRKK